MALRSIPLIVRVLRQTRPQQALLLLLLFGCSVATPGAARAQEPVITDLPQPPPPWDIPQRGESMVVTAEGVLLDDGSASPLLLAAPSRNDLPAPSQPAVAPPVEEFAEYSAPQQPLAEPTATDTSDESLPVQPHSWEVDAVAPSLVTCCQTFIPSAANLGAPGGAQLTPLPRLVNGLFDDTDIYAGWDQTIQGRFPECVQLPEQSFPLVSTASVLGDLLSGILGDGSTLPTETTNPQVAWLGGGGGTKGQPCDPDGLAVLHRLFQRVTLPADYGVRLQFDVLIQSVEKVCNSDGASVLANGVRLPISIPLCKERQINQWSGRSVDLSPWRGQSVTLEFNVAANNSLNSNLWLDNIRLCGRDARLPVADQCPIAGWQEPSPNSASLGGVSRTPGRSYDPAIAVSHIGRVYVTWADQSTASAIGEIYIRRWNGISWESVGMGSASGGGLSNTPNDDSAHPVVAVSPSGIPYVAWHEKAGADFEIYVKQFVGVGWAQVGTNSAFGGGISNNATSSFRSAITIASDGRPVVAWTDGSPSNTEIYLRKFNGSGWIELGLSANGGGVSSTAGESGDAALAAGRSGVIYLAWTDATSGNAEIYVRRWNGSNWVEVGAGSASGGGISKNAGASYAPTIAVGSDGLPVVAWVDRSGGDTEIYARKWNGNAWVELGAGSASGGGVSNNDGASLDPSLTIGSNNRPLIAWTDLSGFNAEIYVRHWANGIWSGYGGGSAGFGGISNSTGFSSEPVAAIGRDGVVSVAWTDDGLGRTEIFVRRFSLE